MQEKFADQLAGPTFAAYRTDEPVRYRSSHAKNLAHRLSSGRIVCNLDADQYLTPTFLDELQTRFDASGDCVLRSRRSAWGRVALRREAFFAAGGYDEEFVGWGSDDCDLVRRAKLLCGLEEVVAPLRSTPYIAHGDEVRTANMDVANAQQSRMQNRAKTRENVRQGRLVANENKDWGRGNVRRILPRAPTTTRSKAESERLSGVGDVQAVRRTRRVVAEEMPGESAAERSIEESRPAPCNRFRRYNPGIVECDGKLLLAFRESPPGKSWASLLYLADLTENRAENVRPLRVPAPEELDDGVSDPRLFLRRDRVWVSYSRDRGRFRTSDLAIAECDVDGTARGERVFPRLNGGSQEKNWQFFEHEDELLIIYSVAPDHVVLDSSLREIARTPGVVWYPGFRSASGIARGGTPPQRIGDRYVSFFHTVTERRGGFQRRIYTIGAYEFEAEPPFRIVRQSETPLLVPDLADRPADSMRPHVVFPCGAVRRSNGSWIVAYGCYDDRARLLRLDDPFAMRDPRRQGELVEWI